MSVDTDSLINQAIEAKAALQSQRDRLEAQRRGLVQQLGVTRPRNRAQVAQIKAQISGLDLAERNLNTQQRSQDSESNLRVNSAFRNAHIAKLGLDAQNHEQTATQAANLLNGLASLQAKYPNRGYDGNQSAKFHSEMEQLTNENPMGMHSQSAAAAIRSASTSFDNQRAKTLNDSAQKLLGLTGLTPDQFAARDKSKDFATHAKTLAEANSNDPQKNLRAEDGKYTVFTASGRQHIIESVPFNHYNANFKLPTQAESAPVAGQQVNVPADQPPKGTNYTFSGTETPNHPGDYWSEPQSNGLVTHHFASGGSATVADHATPEGQELINNARQQTADRKQFIDKNPGALSGFGAGDIGQHSGAGNMPLQSNIPANIPSAPPVEPIQAAPPAASQPNVLVQPYQMGDEKAGVKPSLQVNPSAATLPSGVQPIKPNPDAYIQQGRIELAKFALTDPNANEAHKAAARQILGIKEDGQ